MTDKTLGDARHDHLPEPIRSLAKCGKVFGVAVDKRPFLPRRWKEDSHLLKTYSEALAACEQLIADGKNAVVYMVLTNTRYRLLDFDPDKTTGQLRDSQTKAISYYREKKNPILESSSGVGRHIVVEDEDKQLPKIDSGKVEAGKIPFEVKHDLMFVTGKIIESQSIKPVDEFTVKRATDVTNSKTLPKPTSTTKPNKLSKAKKKEALAILRDAIQWAKDNEVTNVVYNGSTFDAFVMGAHQAGMPNDEQFHFCTSQDGDQNGIMKRIESTNEPEFNVQGNLIKLFEVRGYVIDSNEPPKGTFPVAAELGRKGGFKYCLRKLGIEVRYNELVGIEVKLPDKDWQELDDTVFETIANDWVGEQARRKHNKIWTPFEPSNEVMRSVYKSMASKNPPHNPTREWLKTITPKEDLAAIDEYINCYKIDCYGRLADKGWSDEQILEYYRVGFTLMMAGWIMRSLEPGCLYDKFVVLIGERGCGKGLGLQLQLPPESVDPITGVIKPNKAFKDGCRLSDDRSAWYHNRKASLGEVTELVGFSKPGNDKLKAIISARNDNVELKYQNYNESVPKSYGLVGTTNNRNFKPADGEGDRRLYIMDLGYKWEGGKNVTRKMLPQILTDRWRERAVGHILWLIQHGYTADHRDWSDEVEAMRNVMSGSSSKEYPRIEAALLAIAHGTVEYEKTVVSNGESRTFEREEWAHYGYGRLINTDGINHVLRHGLPLNPQNHPEDQPTWMRLLALHDKTLVDKYDADKVKFVAVEHMGWTLRTEPTQAHGHKQQRNWLVPNPQYGDPRPSAPPEPTPSVSTYMTDTPSPTTAIVDHLNSRKEQPSPCNDRPD